MKVKKNVSILFLSILAILCALVGLTTMQSASVHATSTFEMVSGASIRAEGTDKALYGIKFAAKISSDLYDANDDYYVMIIPSGWLEKFDLIPTQEIPDPDYFDVLVNEQGKVWQGDDSVRTINIMPTVPVLNKKDGYYYASGSITSIKYENTFREFFGIVFKADENLENREYATLNDNIRSVSEVASVALNDSETVFTTEQINYFNETVKNAYNAKNGKSATDAQDDLPDITSAISNMVVSNGTKFSLKPTNLPDGLGINVVYTSSNNDAISIDENGLATVLADSGSVDLTVKVLGKTFTNTITLRPAMAENMLEDFNSELSANNVQYNVWANCGDGGFPGIYHPTYNDATGVIEIKGHENGASQTPIRFNKTEQELYEILQKSESITIKVCSTTNVWLVPAGTTGFVLKQSDGWKEIVINKTDLLTGTTLEAFCKAHCNTGNGKGGAILSRANNGDEIYIDSISFNEIAPTIELASYTAPTTAGGTFTLPKATLKQGDLVIDDAQISVTASVNVPTPSTGGTQKDDISLNVANIAGVNKIKVHSGTTKITYSCEYKGQTYTKTITYTISDRAAMASDMLEDFDDAASVYNLSNSASGSFNPSYWPASEYLDVFQEANGVVKFTAGSDGAKTVKVIFNKTEAELIEIMQTLEKATFKIYNDTDSAKAFYGKDTSTFIKALGSKVWTEVNMTKAQLLAGMTGSTDEEKIANFAKMYCKTGTGSTALFRVDKSSIIYIDSISFTTAE